MEIILLDATQKQMEKIEKELSGNVIVIESSEPVIDAFESIFELPTARIRYFLIKNKGVIKTTKENEISYYELYDNSFKIPHLITRIKEEELLFRCDEELNKKLQQCRYSKAEPKSIYRLCKSIHSIVDVKTKSGMKFGDFFNIIRYNLVFHSNDKRFYFLWVDCIIQRIARLSSNAKVAVVGKFLPYEVQRIKEFAKLKRHSFFACSLTDSKNKEAENGIYQIKCSLDEAIEKFKRMENA